MKGHDHGILDALGTMVVEVWLWITIGLLGVLAFFGKRLLSKWDVVMSSHMPDHVIEKKLTSIRNDMEDCQKSLSQENRESHRELQESIGEVHTRLDDLYKLLLQRRRE